MGEGHPQVSEESGLNQIASFELIWRAEASPSAAPDSSWQDQWFVMSSFWSLSSGAVCYPELPPSFGGGRFFLYIASKTKEMAAIPKPIQPKVKGMTWIQVRTISPIPIHLATKVILPKSNLYFSYSDQCMDVVFAVLSNKGILSQFSYYIQYKRIVMPWNKALPYCFILLLP